MSFNILGKLDQRVPRFLSRDSRPALSSADLIRAPNKKLAKQFVDFDSVGFNPVTNDSRDSYIFEVQTTLNGEAGRTTRRLELTHRITIKPSSGPFRWTRLYFASFIDFLIKNPFMRHSTCRFKTSNACFYHAADWRLPANFLPDDSHRINPNADASIAICWRELRSSP